MTALLVPPPASWRGVARLVRGLPARVLHGLRRRSAIAHLRARGLPRSILIVCHGNICRSPYAAARLRQLLPARGAGGGKGDGIVVGSAGFIGARRPSPPEAVLVARAHGVDLSEHRSQLLGPQEVAAAELILVMEPAQQRAVCGNFGRSRGDVVVLGDLDPEPINGRAIRDPVEQPASVFEESYARIDRCLGTLVSVMSAGRSR